MEHDYSNQTGLDPFLREPKKKKRVRGAGVFLGFVLGLVTAALVVIGTAFFLLPLLAARLENPAQNTGENEYAVVPGSEILTQEVIDKLLAVEARINRYYLYDENLEALQDGMLSGLVGALEDDYAYYYNEEEFQQLLESNSGTYQGIGVQVSQKMDTFEITVTKVFKGAPAEEAGIRPGDILLAVEDMDVSDMDLNTVVTYIRGDEGTKVNLTFYRPEIQKTVEFEVERRSIDTPSVEFEMLDNRIGYIKLEEFSENTYDQYMNALNSLKEQGMEGLLVDVRNNPGGLLESVVAILDEMLPEGTLVTIRNKDGEEEVYTSDEAQAVKLPIVVLTNGNSASAAEIYTAALQDYGAATIVGTKTFGKGIVQSIMTLPDKKSALKITTASYYTPKGVCIHGEGIEPDVEVELAEGLETMIEIPQEEDNQLQEAIRILLEKMR